MAGLFESSSYSVFQQQDAASKVLRNRVPPRVEPGDLPPEVTRYFFARNLYMAHPLSQEPIHPPLLAQADDQ